MTIDAKHLGLIDRFNGVDIEQTRHYIKIHGKTYIQKIFEAHRWLEKDKRKPISMNYDSKYIHKLKQAKSPLNSDDKVKLQIKMGFNYRQAMGERYFMLWSHANQILLHSHALN